LTAWNWLRVKFHVEGGRLVSPPPLGVAGLCRSPVGEHVVAQHGESLQADAEVAELERSPSRRTAAGIKMPGGEGVDGGAGVELREIQRIG
jgi:hypothetical protein